MSEPANGTDKFRISLLEKDADQIRTRVGELVSELSALRLALQRATDQVEHLNEDVTTLKRAFYTFAFSVVGAAILFAFTVFSLLGPH